MEHAICLITLNVVLFVKSYFVEQVTVFQFPQGFFHIRVVLYAGISRNSFCLQHGGNDFLVRLLQSNFKRKATGTK